MDRLIEIIVLGTVILMRLWSRSEHKKSHEEIKEIKIYINGEMEKRIEQAKEEGRQEEKNKTKNTNL